MEKERKKERPLKGELIPLVGILKTTRDIIKKEPNVISEWWKNEKTIDTWKAGAVAGYQIAFLMLLVWVLVMYVF
ncbi:MAG: hypothetical protein GF421_11235 [Candidatus Aminicenantes bacterium]|nr:hypothetical protein [Candidatus Aminicenantes bacterium]